MQRRMFVNSVAALLCGLAAAALPRAARGDDWPQLQHDPARTGRTADSVAPPYRARWLWLGPTQTLYNTGNTTTFPNGSMPASVNITIAESVQPVLKNNRVFVGTMDGGAYAINATDGSTLWSAALDTGTLTTAAVADNGTIVVFTTLGGTVYGLNTSTGAAAWTFHSPGAFTAAPCVKGTSVYVADHKGWVTALNVSTGQLLWRKRLMQGAKGSPVYGGMCADATSLYVGDENMYVFAISLTTGQVRAQHRVYGQSFRNLWPMVFNNLVFVSSGTTPIVGSEYIGEHNVGSNLFEDPTTLAAEETNLALWLAGDTNGGRNPDAGVDWRHYFALSTTDLSEPFTVLAGPSDGTGSTQHPPVLDNSGRVLAYFKTKFPLLTHSNPIFGTNFSQDIAGINMTNGHRIPIDNSKLCQLFPWETDNLFGMSVGGTYLWLRQNFRGTQNINLATSTSRGVQVEIRVRDGGDFSGYDIKYKDANPPTGTSQSSVQCRTAVIISGTKVYFTETFGVTAIEHF